MQYYLKPLAFTCFFFLVQCDYNETLAKKLVYLSSAAYSNATNLCLGTIFDGTSSSYTILDSFEEICDEVGHTCSGFIIKASLEKNIYYVFSGSHGPTQVLMQAYAALKPDKDFYGMGQVMGYFKNAHDVLWSHVKTSMMNPKYKNYTSIFTGHSLGGSLATLAAAQCAFLSYCTPDKVELYTFGKPRTGSVKFAKSLDGMIGENFRVVHRYDIVPEVPACAKTGGLLSLFFNTGCSDAIPTNPYHHGTEMWYNNDMVNEPYIRCTELTAIQNCPFSFQYINVFLRKGAAHIEEHKHYFDIVVTEYGKLAVPTRRKQFTDEFSLIEEDDCTQVAK